MRIYRRGKIWWLEISRCGKDGRISLHTDRKATALSIMREMESARDQSRRDVKTRSLLSIVEVVCREYGSTIEELAAMIGAQPTRRVGKDVVIGLPLADAFQTYEDTARSCALLPSEQTEYRRLCMFNRFVKWCGSAFPTAESVQSITGRMAARFAGHLADSGLATKTRKNILGELGTIWTILAKAVDGLANPWANLSPRDVDGRRGDAFSREEEEAVLDAARKVGKDWYPVCMVMRHTGLRYGDVARLKWSDVDMDGMVMNVTPNKTARKGITVHPAIIPEVADALRDLPRAGEYLFPLHAKWYGNRGRQSREALSFREVLDAAGIKRYGITVHSWRHTAASRLAEAGVGKETRKLLLGHTVDDTADRYDHASHAAEIRAAQESAAK